VDCVEPGGSLDPPGSAFPPCFKICILVKENAAVVNLWIMIELDPLYKNASDTFLPSLLKKRKKYFFS